ncbi:transglycosylase family protein [Streptomyces sp. NPDC046316]|uniref:transglycosylase family protein n=1 Tax=Streptomyces sp. NPDC046316 TaxID=3154494 RepID=UPI0034051ACB
MALPLLGAGSASAADAATWDRVAECESGGLWSAHFGNGLYGGLQFTQESWERHGGLAYATSADLASRAQQIAVAERAFAAGDTQWATCAPIAGLTNDGARPDVDPGPAVKPAEPTGPLPESNRTAGLPAGSETSSPEADTPEAETPETTSRGTDRSTATPEASTTPGTSGTPTAPSTPGTGKHRGDAAPEESVNPGKSGEKGRHASPADSPTGTPSDTPTPDADADADAADQDNTGSKGAPDSVDNTAAQDIADAIGEYTVKPGDNLSVIAQQNELPGGWGALYDANRSTVGADPDLILPGQSLDLSLGSTANQG